MKHYIVQTFLPRKGVRHTVRHMRTLEDAQEYAKKMCKYWSTYPRKDIVKEGNIEEGLYFSGTNADKRAGRIILSSY